MVRAQVRLPQGASGATTLELSLQRIARLFVARRVLSIYSSPVFLFRRDCDKAEVLADSMKPLSYLRIYTFKTIPW